MAEPAPPAQQHLGFGEEIPHDGFPPDFQQKRAPASSPKRRQNGSVTATKAHTYRQRRKRHSLIGALCSWVVEHQIGLAGNLMLLLAFSHLLIPRSRPHTRKFFELSYYNPESGRYGLGINDLFLVLYWITIFTGLRVATMDYVLVPFARWGGIEKKKGKIRFAEQGWLFIYYGVLWSLGIYIYYNSSYWLNLREMWTNFPTAETDGLLKWYYLVQFAFYLQQIIVVNIEERRKDYHQMFTHHIITCFLIFFSYAYLQTKVGHVILCLMDVVDILLALAKMLNYLGFKLICDTAFGVFIVSWFAARHVLYLMVCWSIYKDVPANMPYGCYSGKTGQELGPASESEAFGYMVEPLRNPYGTVCFNERIKWIFLTMLLALQVILLIWFGMIVGVAWRVLNGSTAEDSRSDAEDEVEEEEELAEDDTERNPLRRSPPYEEEVGVESINLKGRASPVRRFRKSAGTASGATLPGHSDRKELLGRIGCETRT